MKNGDKSPYLMIAFGVALFAALMNLDMILGALKQLLNLLLPLLIGLILAFMLNVPMHGIQKRLTGLVCRAGRKPPEKLINVVSLIVTLALIILIFIIAIRGLIPAMMDSVSSAVVLAEEKWPQMQVYLEDFNIDVSYITEFLASGSLEEYISQVVGSAGAVAGHVVNFASSTVTIIAAAAVGIVISVYVLLSKDYLGRCTRKVLYAYLKKPHADKIYHVARLINNTYAKFLSGQFLEACILGTLIALAFSVFKLPYAGLVGLLTGISAFIPYIGAFCACAIGAILTLLVDPARVLICIAVFLTVQFIENQFIYPHVVGGSVGLPPLLTLMAVLIGGKLFGLIGMIMFIPIMSVIVQLLEEATDRRLTMKPQRT